MSGSRPGSGYPFVTKRMVIARLDASKDPTFVRECMDVLHRRFLERDRLVPPAGWMSSHRKLGEELYARLAAADCTDADVARAAALARRYSKQLCKVLRDEQIAREPALALAAAVFGVRSGADQAALDGDDPYAEGVDDAGVSEEASHDARVPDSELGLSGESAGTMDVEASPPSAPSVAPVVRRRPGRPRGSKNKKASEAAKPGKRGRRR